LVAPGLFHRCRCCDDGGCQACNGKSGVGVTWSGQLSAQGVTVVADLTTFRIGDMLRIGQNMYRVEDKVPPGEEQS